MTLPAMETKVSVTFPEDLMFKYTVELSATPRVVVSEKGHGGFEISLVSSQQAQDQVISYTVSTLPADIKQAIGYKAALLPLDVAGDLIAGAGVASISVGVDGMHQSINTTSSSTNAGLGARVLQYERELKALMPALKAKYKMMNVGVL